MDRLNALAQAFPAGVPDLDRFVDVLFRYADPETYISLRAFDQNNRAQPPILIEAVRVGEGKSTIVAKAARASTRAANQARPGVFAPPVATFSNPRSAAEGDLANGVAISVEIDAGDPLSARRRLEHLLGPVTLALHSGSEWLDPHTGQIHPKTHLHWRLSEPTRTPEDHALLKRARWAAAVLVGADRTAVPPVHPLRWPGSWNLKNAPRIAQICAGNSESEVHLQDALEKLEEAVEGAGLKIDDQPHVAGSDPQARIEKVRSALEAIPNDSLDWDDWNRIGMATWRATGGSTDGLHAWSDWSAKCGKHHDDECSARWLHFATSPPTKIGAGTLFYLASQNGWSGNKFQEIGMDDREAPPWDIYFDGAPEIPATKAAEKTRLWVIDQPWSEKDIPSRPWVVRGFLLRGSITVISGPGSAGKSSLMVSWAVSLALGLDFGRFRPDKPFKVLSYNVEDDRHEQMRRISATCRQFARSPNDVMPNVRMIGPTEMGTLLHLGPDGRILVNTPVMHELEEYIDLWKPDVVMLDPFVELHSSEENDNTAIRQVLARFRSWAVRQDVALVVLHHARKGAASPGDPDSLRGASAIVGAARIALTVNTMTDAEAQDMSVPAENRRDYFRLDGAKMNYSRVQDADWFERTEYTLDNDEGVAAAVPWAIPQQVIGLSHVAQLVSLIERGSSAGPYSPKLSKEPRSIKVAMEAIGVTLPNAQKILLSQVLADQDVLLQSFISTENRSKKQGMRTANGPLAKWVEM